MPSPFADDDAGLAFVGAHAVQFLIPHGNAVLAGEQSIEQTRVHVASDFLVRGARA